MGRLKGQRGRLRIHDFKFLRGMALLETSGVLVMLIWGAWTSQNSGQIIATENTTSPEKVAKEGNFGTQDSTFLSEFPHIKDPVNLHKSQAFFLQKHRLHSASVRIFRLWRFSSKMWPCSSLSWRWTREIEDPGGSGRILWSHSIINSCFLVTLIGGIGDI